MQQSRTTRQKTKTGVDREIDLPLEIRSFLREMKPKDCDPSALIFPSPKGKAINDRLFCRRAWKSVLASCEIQYKPPYKMRHSALSHGYANGADPLELARQAGNSLRTLQENYLGSIKRTPVFVGFLDSDD